MSDCSFTQHFCLFASGSPAPKRRSLQSQTVFLCLSQRHRTFLHRDSTIQCPGQTGHSSHWLFFMSITATQNILTQKLNDPMSRSNRSLQSLNVFYVYHSDTKHSYTETQRSNVQVTQITPVWLFFISITATQNILTQRLNDPMSRSHRSLQSLTVFHVYHSDTKHSYTETQGSNLEVTRITSVADCFLCILFLCLLQRLMRQRKFFHGGPTAKSDHSCQQTRFQMAGRGENWKRSLEKWFLWFFSSWMKTVGY